jgi:hypothetical protein
MAFKKGYTPWNKGGIGPNKGKIFDKEWRNNLRISHLGNIPWNKGIKIKSLSDEHKNRLSVSGKESWIDADDRRKETSERTKKLKLAETYRKGRRDSKETRRKKSEALKGRSHLELYGDRAEEIIGKRMKAMHIHPNKPETILLNLLEQIYPGEWKFVGDGKVIIAGKCPDFINVNGQKRIIELFGDYWHRNDNPEDRVNVFKPYGYETLIIWEKELKDMGLVKKKILSAFVH